MISPIVKLHLTKIIVSEPNSLVVKQVSELVPCFLVVVGHYIYVKSTQKIFLKKTLQSKKQLYFFL
jgi:hypothetical protein